MRVTVCELPHERRALRVAWAGLCAHTLAHSSELVLLPEFAMVEPVWEAEQFNLASWIAAEELWSNRTATLPKLHATYVVGTRPVSAGARRFNQGYVIDACGSVSVLRSKYFVPDEAGFRETRWFDAGDAGFPPFHVGAMSFGLNICTELWALESYAGYAKSGVHAVLAPRATAADTTAKWLSIGVVAAVRSGAFCLSSNRIDETGNYGGVGWIIDPDGRILATTSREAPFATVDIDLGAAIVAHESYPRTALR